MAVDTNNNVVRITVNENTNTGILTVSIPGIQGAIGPQGPQGPAGSPTNFIDDDGTTPSDGPNATGAGSLAMGYDSDATGANSFSDGTSVRASGDFSYASGYKSNTNGIYGAEAFASGSFSVIGDAQRLTYVLRNETTDGTSKFLTSDGQAAGVTNQIVVPTNTSLFFTADLIGRRTDSNTEAISASISGAVDRDLGDVSLLGKQDYNILAKDNTNWTFDVEANSTNQALQFKVTGVSGSTIRWLAKVETVEIKN